MTTHSVRRWGAVLLAGGCCLGAAYLFYPSTAHSSLIRPAAALALLGVLLTIPGLIALQRGQQHRSPVLGWAGVGFLSVGIVLLEVPHTVLGAFHPSGLYDLDSYHASLFGTLEFPGVIVIVVGEILLTVALARAKVYPTWSVWLMIANLVISAAGSTVVSINDAVHMPAPDYLLMGLLGVAMMQAAREHHAAPVLEPTTSAPA